MVPMGVKPTNITRTLQWKGKSLTSSQMGPNEEKLGFDDYDCVYLICILQWLILNMVKILILEYANNIHIYIYIHSILVSFSGCFFQYTVHVLYIYIYIHTHWTWFRNPITTASYWMIHYKNVFNISWEYIYIYIIYTYVYIYVYIYAYVYMYMYMYIHIYIYVYIYIHMGGFLKYGYPNHPFIDVFPL